MVEITSFTKEERELADLIDRAKQDRFAEDEAIRLKAEEEAKVKLEAAMLEVEKSRLEVSKRVMRKVMQKELRRVLLKNQLKLLEMA